MIDQQISLTTASGHDQAMLVDLHLAQQMRLSRLDARLHTVLSLEDIKAVLLQGRPREKTLYAVCDTRGRIRGYVQPALWTIHEQSMLLAFLTTRNGTARRLTLPAPDEHDALEVTGALLHALNKYWQRYATSGDLIQWPSRDTWLEPILKQHGFLLDSVCAFHPCPSALESVATPFIIRPAQLGDQERLLALFCEELLAHEPYTPFVRLTPTVQQAFLAKLERLWQGMSLEENAPLMLVVERNGEVVAMAQCSLLNVRSGDEPGFTPPGCYGCIDNICVQASMRGQGIGRQLVRAVYAAFAETHLKLDGYLLWYNPDNPLASSFWSRSGFEPLWTTYQRLHS